MSSKTKRLLPNGLIVHINGIPVTLIGRAVARTNEANWELIGKPAFFRVVEAGDPGFGEEWDGELPEVKDA